MLNYTHTWFLAGTDHQQLDAARKHSPILCRSFYEVALQIKYSRDEISNFQPLAVK